jgi:hypothetical protein
LTKISTHYGPNDKSLLSNANDRDDRTNSDDSEDVTMAISSPDGKLIASASRDQIIKVWSSEGKKLHFRLEGHSSQVIAIAFSPDGKHLHPPHLTALSGPGTCRLARRNINLTAIRKRYIRFCFRRTVSASVLLQLTEPSRLGMLRHKDLLKRLKP